MISGYFLGQQQLQMSKVTYPFLESLLVGDNFLELPIIPVQLRFNEKYLNCFGLIDTGATVSYIDVNMCKRLNTVIVDTISTTTLHGQENKPMVNIEITIQALDGFFLPLKLGAGDLQHPSIQILLGRDFLEYFKLEFDQKSKVLSLEYTGDI